jgi:hypothetical protein
MDNSDIVMLILIKKRDKLLKVQSTEYPADSSFSKKAKKPLFNKAK